MSKYIDADKLRSVLQNTINSMKEKDAKGERYDAFLNGKLSICEELLGCIDSLQQQPAKQLGGTFTSYDMAKTFTEGQNYVIAHPEKFGLCKPAEWSEEDEHCIHQLILFCENCMQQDSEAIRCATWLKSLRPQPHWKPSEEQMKCLDDCVNRDREVYNASTSGCDAYHTLRSLYHDLQKLL